MSRLLRTVVAVLACVVAILGIGAALPVLLIGNGVGQYEGENWAYAEYALLYDLELKEWPLPIDPMVARTATDVRPHPGECKIDVDAYPAIGDDPDVTRMHSAEVIHYGPFFVPTGTNVIV